jgi:hypothetical protein
MEKFDLHEMPGKTFQGIRILAVFPQEEVKNGTFHAHGRMECPNCGGRMIVNGYFATGEKLLSGYTPEKGELVQNKIMECNDCHDWQVS